jgi:plastocyanin
MWYRWQRTSALAALMGLLAVAAAGCTGSSSGSNGSSGEAAALAPDTADETQTAEAVQIVIDNFTFSPAKLTISAGTKVTWVNHDDVPHTATSTAKPKRFDSGTLDTDEKFSHQFTATGTYDYFCAVHPKMTGQIVVK